MNNKKRVQFEEWLKQLPYSTNVQETWSILEKGVTDLTSVKHQERIDRDEEGSAFHDWCNSCFELLLPRQVVISDVKFDSSSRDEQKGEYIELYNTGPAIVDITKWSICASNQNITFTNEQLIKPGEKICVYADNASLNYKGDFVQLYDGSNTLISSWNYGYKAHSLIVISHICFDGNERYTEADEFVELQNYGASWVDLSNWQLSAGKNQKFTFPEGSAIKPYSAIRIYTNHIDKTTGGFSFNSKSAVWNNQGDIGTLFDYLGGKVCEYRYGEM